MAGGIYAYFRWQHDKKDRAFKLRSKMADLEMMALRAQMNPHFIFNCLSSIQSYILVADVRNANLYLHKLSVLIRKILQYSPRPYSTLTEELTVLRLYMELEKLRLADRMDYSIEVARDLHPEDILIPSLILQPFAENAIQHGISPLQDRKGVVRISFSRSGRYLVCTIEDNGVGIHASRREKPQVEHISMGLSIISHRVRIINAIQKEAVSIKITDKSENEPHVPGTIAQIYFPI
jgi:LytS/YehU family sensor histidine kinase